MSIEQMVRDLLEQAVKEGIVALAPQWRDPEPQARSTGELVGTANMLADFLRRAQADLNDRWQSAVGQPLEQAERLARL